ncbi:MAG: ATP-binding protein [Agathobacter sp.]|nr:ATP-binding protein [Agathobacter sp.]
MKKKINIRLVGIAVLAIIATLIGTTTVYYKIYQMQVRKDLTVTAQILSDTHFLESDNIDTHSIDLSTDNKACRVTWIDKDGTVIYDNDASAQKLTNHMDRPEIKEAFATGKGESIRRSDTMNKDTFYYAVLLQNDTVLRVATEAESIWSVFVSSAPMTALIILCIITICIVFSHLLTKQLIAPIERMAEKLEDKDYESPYKELEPFSNMLRSQHADILSAAKARQDFTANVSHELKTPLTAISGYAELLEGDMVGEEQKKHFYKEIHKNADRLLALINDIIQLSELDRNEKEQYFEEVDLYETVAECMDMLEQNARRREVTLELKGESGIVHGNKSLLGELVENLVQNAIRYNNPGGKVNVSIGVHHHRPTLIVEDNGIGIPADEQERVFERFYRVDKSRSKETGGTGLGLAIVKHIVELHGAQIKLRSTLGEGTRIEVIF